MTARPSREWPGQGGGPDRALKWQILNNRKDSDRRGQRAMHLAGKDHLGQDWSRLVTFIHHNLRARGPEISYPVFKS